VKVLYSWLREFVDVQEPPEAIGARMSLRGLALEGLERDGDDAVLDFEVTANRPDCLSVVGIAREIATVYQVPLKGGRVYFSEATQRKLYPASFQIPIDIDEPALCSRYVGAVADVKLGPSPAWLQRRLEACGVRPISNIVDITNYVLLEMGHPMHAFDYHRLAGPAIRVRRARAGESLRTLDGKLRTLTPDILVIADAERAQAVGGVMGGADSEVSASTRRIVLEAAWFEPSSIRATGRSLGLKTEASVRFERGMDVTAPGRAMARAAALLTELGAATDVGAAIDVYPRRHVPAEVRLPRAAASGLLGMDVPDDEAARILAALGFEVRDAAAAAPAAPPAPAREAPAAPVWTVTAPPWRVDIQRPVDLVEEIGRHHGFEYLPATFPAVEQPPAPSDPRIPRDARVRRALLAMGFSEAITFAFIEEGSAAPFLCGDAPVALANPLSEKFAVMRPSLLPGLIDAVSHNRRHGRADVRLFEIGTRFSRRGESRAAAIAWMGLATPDHWGGGRRAADFFDVKGVVDQLATLAQVQPSFAEASAPFLVAGRAAAVVVDGQTVGVFGLLRPDVARARDLPDGDEVYVAEVDLDRLVAAAPALRLTEPLPRYPFVVRDLSILVDESLSAEKVRGTIRAAAPAILVSVREFDRYQGKGVPDGKVSLSLRLTFQAPDRTLTDEEVHAGIHAVVAALARTFNAVQR
jgi:phenylalanyl-tRNA synthetase beta chain